MRFLPPVIISGLLAIALAPTPSKACGPVRTYGSSFGVPGSYFSYGTPTSAYYGSPIVSSYTPYYSTPVVHERVVEVVAPIAVPVVVPSTVFQYLPALSPGCASGTGTTAAVAGQTAQAQQAQVQAPTVQAAQPQQQQVAAAAPTSPPASTQANLEANIDGLIKARLEAVIREKMTGLASDAPPPLDDGEARPKETEYGATSNKPHQQQPNADAQSVALGVIGNDCMSCHKQGSEKGGVVLVNEQNQWAPSRDGAPLSLASIAQAVESGRMPKLNASLHNQPLAQDRKAALIAWLRRG